MKYIDALGKTAPMVSVTIDIISFPSILYRWMKVKTLTNLGEKSVIVECILIHRDTGSIPCDFRKKPPEECCSIEVFPITKNLIDCKDGEHNITS